MKLNKLFIYLSRICLGISLLFLLPGLFIAEINPHDAIDISAIAYIFLLICWVLNFITQKF
jgi:hypothetical protein